MLLHCIIIFHQEAKEVKFLKTSILYFYGRNRKQLEVIFSVLTFFGQTKGQLQKDAITFNVGI